MEHIERNEEITKEDILQNESDIISGMLAAAEDMTKITTTIEIARPVPGKPEEKRVYFRFRITGLDEEVYQKCRKQSTTYKKNRALGGITMPEDTNTTQFRSRLIYEATIPEDRAKTWDNQTVRKELEKRLGKLIAGFEIVDACLFGGEKEAIVEKIDQMSGYDSDLEEVAKK